MIRTYIPRERINRSVKQNKSADAAFSRPQIDKTSIFINSYEKHLRSTNFSAGYWQQRWRTSFLGVIFFFNTHTSHNPLFAKPKSGSVVDSYQTVSVNCSSCRHRLFRYKKKNGVKSNLIKCYVERIVQK